MMFRRWLCIQVLPALAIGLLLGGVGGWLLAVVVTT